jgi:hypothetical protein
MFFGAAEACLSRVLDSPSAHNPDRSQVLACPLSILHSFCDQAVSGALGRERDVKNAYVVSAKEAVLHALVMLTIQTMTWRYSGQLAWTLYRDYVLCLCLELSLDSSVPYLHEAQNLLVPIFQCRTLVLAATN